MWVLSPSSFGENRRYIFVRNIILYPRGFTTEIAFIFSIHSNLSVSYSAMDALAYLLVAIMQVVQNRLAGAKPVCPCQTWEGKRQTPANAIFAALLIFINKNSKR
jgi:hypothetical protein